MNVTRTRTKHVGVFERESSERLHKGKPDIAYDVCYKFEGKLIWEKIGWKSEGYSPKLASDIRSDRLRAIRHGQELPKQKKKIPLFEDAVKEYLKWAEVNKARSGRSDKSLYENHLKKFDKKRLSEITSFDLERLKASLMKKNELSAATIKHALILVRQVFNKAIAWKLYEGTHPLKGVRLPRLANMKDRFITHEEADALLKAINEISPQMHDMCLLALHTGMRFGEITALKAQDLDFENGFINIADPKNKETRKAFMTKAVKEMLESRKPENPDEYVFKARDGGRIGQATKSFERAVNKVGLNDGIEDSRLRITFHSLRHTFASWLAMQGETILTIKELLGHKSLAMTLRYAHLIPDHKRRAIRNMERVFEKKRNGEILKVKA